MELDGFGSADELLRGQLGVKVGERGGGAGGCEGEAGRTVAGWVCLLFGFFFF